MKKGFARVLLAAFALLTVLAVTVLAEAPDVITEPGEGKLTVYRRSSVNTAFYAEGTLLKLLYQSGTSAIVECDDGTVYWQNPVSTFLTGAWIKGTKIDDTTIEFPTGQPILYDEEYDATLTVNWGYFDGRGFACADTLLGNRFVLKIDGNDLILQNSDPIYGFVPALFPGVFYNGSFQGYGDCGVTLTRYAVINGTTQRYESTNHGYITLDKLSADKGETVTVGVFPSESYVLDDLYYVGTDGVTQTPIEKDDSDAYTFIMPEEAVTVYAVFAGTRPVFVTADEEHPVDDAASFGYYVVGSTIWKNYTFAGWFYDDGGTVTLFEGGYDAAEDGVIYTARWKNAAGNYVFFGGISVGVVSAVSGEDTVDMTILADFAFQADGIVTADSHIGFKVGESAPITPAFDEYGIAFAPAGEESRSARLTFNNVSIEAGDGFYTNYAYQSGEKIYAAFFNGIPLELALIGDNSITISRNDPDNCTYGIFGIQSLTVIDADPDGGGNLTVDAIDAVGYDATAIMTDASLTNKAYVTALGGTAERFAYGIYCGYLENTAGTLIGVGGTGQYANGLNPTMISSILGGEVMGCGGIGTEECYGLWSGEIVMVCEDGSLLLFGGKDGDGADGPALFLENEYGYITVEKNGVITSYGTVKNLGTYDDGYTVSGAQTDITSGSNTELIPTDSDFLVITAKQYTVRFEANGGTPEIADVTTAAYVTEPKLEKEGFELVGWYRDEAMTNAWYFDNDYAREDMTLYAKWREKAAEKDALALDVTDGAFTVTPSGIDAGKGIISVAVYDGARLADVKMYDLGKGDEPRGELSVGSLVRAFWWKDAETMLPLCEAVGKSLTK